VETVSLAALVGHHLDTARAASSGRSAATVFGGSERTLRQTLIALRAGERLDDHENPGEATVHVLYGRVRLTAGTVSGEAGEGELMAVPDARHSLTAIDDSVVLLTVAKLAGNP
jgi:quercetin dioxygenase-like cupin family protein